jgi:hypothetical protein
MTIWSVTGSVSETARQIDMPRTTVLTIVNENKDKEHFVRLRQEKRKEFSDRASVLINQGLTLLERRFERALEHEAELDMMIDEICETNKTVLSQGEKDTLIRKLRALQVQDIKAITTALGTLYDKRALDSGEATDRMSIEIKLPEGIEEYAE